ncbi:hypothetical protein CAPTEDRAFT_185843 [Capitella teleta]|uniref:Endonuclease/exonuclease/phosphatase domain-containing protein n=1 Tax=Capitella teleta TaxID=283909 RepID=R7VC80_CAPTE|nr:hypothetical protein CAPTEDRAFT_185843 [Capitella teleta]|eukprot:ELU13926.1 hypothetical protein CAPTEDRAFT_185843 [Capitella teleta]
MAANENLCAENNCCIAGKSPARPSTERPISQPATHHHNDANKTRERILENARTISAVANNAVHTVNDNEGFTKVESRRRPTRPKRSHRIRGTATDSSAKLSAGPETVMMQITNVSPVVTTNELKAYVLAKEGSLSSINIENKTGDGWETKRFVLAIPRSAETTVLDPEFWPSDIFIKKWFKPRKLKSVKEAASVPLATGLGDRQTDFIAEMLSAKKPDVLLLQETWLFESQLTKLSSLHSDYMAHGVSGMPERREIIGDRPFGGVAFLWHRSLAASTKIVRCENNRLCAIYITMDTTAVLLVNAYFPCDNHSKTSVDAEYQAALDSALCLWIESDADVVILGGDLGPIPERNLTLGLKLSPPGVKLSFQVKSIPQTHFFISFHLLHLKLIFSNIKEHSNALYKQR